MQTTSQDGSPRKEGASERSRRDRQLLRDHAQDPTPATRARLIERFMPLARSLAWRYRNSAEPIEDLVQVASEGLIRAVDGFKSDRGGSFSSYATPMILGVLRHYFRDGTNSVHVGRGLGERIQKVRAAEAGLSDGDGGDHGEASRSRRLAELTSLTEEQVDEARRADAERRPVSTDKRLGDREEPEGRALIDTLGASDAGYDRIDDQLNAGDAGLDPRESSVLQLRYGRGLSQREVGKLLAVSQMQISRVQRRALGKLLEAVRGTGA